MDSRAAQELATSHGVRVEKFRDARLTWPREGQHVLGCFDDDGVVVYQAFNDAIGKYAAEHKKFVGAPGYLNRMTWVKTNFLWMMYRSGWGTKKNQSTTLRITVKREWFMRVLAHARTSGGNHKGPGGRRPSLVRLQWDPDHAPLPPYTKQARRAIQLGLRGSWQDDLASGAAVLNIQDISDFVRVARPRTREDLDELVVPVERVFTIDSPEARAAVDPSPWPPKGTPGTPGAVEDETKHDADSAGSANSGAKEEESACGHASAPHSGCGGDSAGDDAAPSAAPSQSPESEASRAAACGDSSSPTS